MFLITHTRTVRQRESQGCETLVERDKDRYVKRWLIEEGAASEDSLQWMSFPDGDKLGLLSEGTRPARNGVRGPWSHYELTSDQGLRAARAGMNPIEWAIEATAKGEAVKRIWPPQEDSSHP